MKLKSKVKFVTGVLLILSLVGIFSSFIFIESYDSKEVSCYDRFNNKIIGEKCIREGYVGINETGEIMVIISLGLAFCMAMIRFSYIFRRDLNFFGFEIKKYGRWK